MLIDGKVIHKSEHNRSDRSRIIYTFHVIEGAVPYPKDNWCALLLRIWRLELS